MKEILKAPYEISVWDEITQENYITITGIYGDIDNNGIINAEDVSLLRSIAEGITPNTKYTSIAGDIDGDGNITSNDYDILLRHVSHISTSDKIGTSFNEEVLDGFYKEERKLCVIGSDTMTSQIRAHNSILTKEINGSNKFTFTIYSKYLDENGNLIDNPFTSLLVNERIIKLEYQNTWYDFVIKNIVENSEQYSYTYECNDLYINELAKNGFSLEFNTELENNQGTITDLAQDILRGTDWQVDLAASETIQQTNDEALYLGTVKSSIFTSSTKIYQVWNNQLVNDPTRFNGKSIYIFYSCLANEEKDLEFIYVSENLDDYIIDEDRLIKNEKCTYRISNVNYDGTGTIKYPDFLSGAPILSTSFIGRKYIRRQRGGVDTAADKVYSSFTPNWSDGLTGEKLICEFEETKYITSGIVFNLLANTKTVVDPTVGWINNNTTIDAKISSKTEGTEVIWNQWLELGFSSNAAYLTNTGVRSNIGKIYDNFTFGERYTLRIKYYNAPSDYSSPLYGKLVYTKDGNSIDILNFSGVPVTYDSTTGYYSITNTVKKSISYSDIIARDASLNFNIYTVNSVNKCKIEDIQLIKYEVDNNGHQIFPESIVESTVEDNYTFYLPNPLAESFDDVEILYNGNDANGTLTGSNYYFIPYECTSVNFDSLKSKLWIKNNNTYTSAASATFDINETYYGRAQSFSPIYSENYEKIRSIEASESNRFNLIQDLCESFECWAKFDIEHDATGKILTEIGYKRLITYTERELGPIEDIDYFIWDSVNKEYTNIHTPNDFKENINYYIEENLPRQKKKVTFLNYIGKDNYSGFKYGINLKSIQRTIDSSAIVTKLIVKPNSNEFAKNGSCTIQAANENLEGLNYILNFDYYINHKLLDKTNLINDLYGTDPNSGYLNYYLNMRGYNRQYQAISGSCVDLSIKLLRLKSSQEVYNTQLEESRQLMSEYNEILKRETNQDWSYLRELTDAQLIANYNSEIINLIHQNHEFEKRMNSSQEQVSILDDQIEAMTSKYDSDVREANNIIKQIEDLERRFFNRYSRFIQEGTWNDDSYYDENLYYLDAVAVEYTSSRPQISYNISVYELSQLEGYENYKFDVGDKTYIEDVEFFGYDTTKPNNTPYQEEVVVSECVWCLDSPEQNTIKIQNYKTQFEDLFQRITATTQSLQYASGSYARAASAIQPNGTINADVLQESFYNNSIIINNAKDQSVVIDDEGITITNTTNPAEIVRLVNSGIVLSKDSGKTWTTGITGSGINANAITAGVINTGQLRIMNTSSEYSAIWDARGISSYSKNGNTFDYTKFTRLDQYGFYGYDGNDKDWFATSINDIEDECNFGLTWNSFFFKGDSNGTVTTINGDGINIKKNGTEVFSIDGSGDVVFGGKLNAAGGTFRGDISGASGTFTGAVKASSMNLNDKFIFDGENVTLSGVTLSWSDLSNAGAINSNTATVITNNAISTATIRANQISAGVIDVDVAITTPKMVTPVLYSSAVITEDPTTHAPIISNEKILMLIQSSHGRLQIGSLNNNDYCGISLYGGSGNARPDSDADNYNPAIYLIPGNAPASSGVLGAKLKITAANVYINTNDPSTQSVVSPKWEVASTSGSAYFVFS